MVTGELSHLAGEPSSAIGQKNFSFADPAWIQQDMSRSRVAGVVFEAEAEVKIAKRNPTGFTTPADMNDTFAVWQQFAESRAGFRRGGVLEACGEPERSSGDLDQTHGETPRSEIATAACSR